MLLAVSGTLQAIAGALGLRSPAAVHQYRDGSRTPTPQVRARMWAEFGIPVNAWSLRPGGGALESQATPLEVSQSLSPAGAQSTLEHCLSLLTVIQRDRSQQGLLPGERVKLAGAEAQILALRARLEQAAEFSEARYVAEHPSWLRLRRAIVRALEPYPIAAKAVLEVVERIERE